MYPLFRFSLDSSFSRMFDFFLRKELIDCCLQMVPEIETGPGSFRFPSLSQTLTSLPESTYNSSQTG